MKTALIESNHAFRSAADKIWRRAGVAYLDSSPFDLCDIPVRHTRFGPPKRQESDMCAHSFIHRS